MMLQQTRCQLGDTASLHRLIRVRSTTSTCGHLLPTTLTTSACDHLLTLMPAINSSQIRCQLGDTVSLFGYVRVRSIASDRSLRYVNMQFALRRAFNQHLINECLIIVPFLNDSVIYAQWQIKTFRNGHPLFTKCRTYTNSWCQEVHSGMILSCK